MRGYTRTASLGPIASFVEGRGGSIGRVFQSVELPLALLDRPDLPLPLGEQFKVLSEAGRSTGDPFFGASLGQAVSIKNLGPFGNWVGNAETLALAIDRAGRGLNTYLQTATVLKTTATDDTAKWSIEFLDPGGEGRFQNELLGISYLIGCIKHFAGKNWSPNLIRSTCVGTGKARKLETIFQAPVQPDHPVTEVEFDIRLLMATGPATDQPVESNFGPYMLGSSNVIGEVTALSSIALLDGPVRIDWVASKIGTSRRTLQRQLEASGSSFSLVLESLLEEHATRLLATSRLTVTEIAHKLGYSEAAQFSRAFRRWKGAPPSVFRRRQSNS